MNDHLQPEDPGLDDLLRARLRSVPIGDDAGARLDDLRPRFHRARRRRQAATAALGTAAAIVGVGLAVTLGGGNETRLDVPAGPASSSTRPSVPASTVTSTTEAPSASTVVVVPATPTTVVASTDSVGGRATTTTRPAATTSRPPSTTAPGGTPAEVATPTAGGTVVVRHDATTVTLVRTEPAAGWSVSETRTEADRVEVRFRRDGSSEEAKVVARIDQGRFRVETS